MKPRMVQTLDGTLLDVRRSDVTVTVQEAGDRWLVLATVAGTDGAHVIAERDTKTDADHLRFLVDR